MSDVSDDEMWDPSHHYTEGDNTSGPESDDILKVEALDPAQEFSIITFTGIGADGNPEYNIETDHNYVCAKSAMHAPFPTVFPVDDLPRIDCLSGCNRVLADSSKSILDDWENIRFTRVSKQLDGNVDMAALIVSVPDKPGCNGADHIFLPSVHSEYDVLMKRLGPSATQKQVMQASDPNKMGISLLPREARKILEKYDFTFSHALSSKSYQTMLSVQKQSSGKPKVKKPSVLPKKPKSAEPARTVAPTKRSAPTVDEDAVAAQPKRLKVVPVADAVAAQTVPQPTTAKPKPVRRRAPPKKKEGAAAGSTATQKSSLASSTPGETQLPASAASKAATPPGPKVVPSQPLPPPGQPPIVRSYPSPIQRSRFTIDVWMEPGEGINDALMRMISGKRGASRV